MKTRRTKAGLFYRRKVLLALLHAFGGRLSKLDLQKYLFLLTQEQETPSYEFVPYKYGCYSFQAAADQRTMMKYGLVDQTDDWILKTRKDYLSLISPADHGHLVELRATLGHLRGVELVKHVYRHHPYYAIHSTIAASVLSDTELEQVRAARPAVRGNSLLTIGYEGRTLEGYLNMLVRHQVRVLCDVRRNPLSMKFGFSKTQLRGATQSLGLLYVHLPELGISSAKRQNLTTVEAYRELFEDYLQNSIPKNHGALQKIVDLIRAFGRVALTCFERDPASCHRGVVARALQEREDWTYSVENI